MSYCQRATATAATRIALRRSALLLTTRQGTGRPPGLPAACSGGSAAAKRPLAATSAAHLRTLACFLIRRRLHDFAWCQQPHDMHAPSLHAPLMQGSPCFSHWPKLRPVGGGVVDDDDAADVCVEAGAQPLVPLVRPCAARMHRSAPAWHARGVHRAGGSAACAPTSHSSTKASPPSSCATCVAQPTVGRGAGLAGSPAASRCATLVLPQPGQGVRMQRTPLLPSPGARHAHCAAQITEPGRLQSAHILPKHQKSKHSSRALYPGCPRPGCGQLGGVAPGCCPPCPGS